MAEYRASSLPIPVFFLPLTTCVTQRFGSVEFVHVSQAGASDPVQGFLAEVLDGWFVELVDHAAPEAAK